MQATCVDAMVNDLSSAPAWRTLREPRLRLIVWALSLSAVVHLVLTPLAGLLGVFAWLLAPPVEDIGAEQLRSIPITFLGFDDPADADATRSGSAAPAGVSEVLSSPEPSPASAAQEAPEPAKPDIAKVAPEALEKPAPAPAAPREIPHPVAMTGIRSEVIDSNASVNLLLLSENIRQHPLGPRIGNLIVNFPQWSSFFESGEIDPVRDINRILIVGPQFRRSADVVAILQHGLPLAVLKRAVDRLVQRPPRGRWLPTKKMPMALAYADRAERLFALTARNVLVVAPPHLEKQVLAAPPTAFPSPEGGEALVLHVKTPWRALIGLPFRLPESIAWLRLDVLPLQDGGAQLRITAEDADAQLAKEHASSLSLALNAVTNPDLGALGALVGLRSIAFIDKLQFQAKGQRITGQVRISPRQLDRLMVYAEEMTAQWTGRRASEARSGGGSTPKPESSASPNRPASAP